MAPGNPIIVGFQGKWGYPDLSSNVHPNMEFVVGLKRLFCYALYSTRPRVVGIRITFWRSNRLQTECTMFFERLVKLAAAPIVKFKLP
jgi:hypothetical protein